MLIIVTLSLIFFNNDLLIEKDKVKYNLTWLDKKYIKRQGAELNNQTQLPKAGIFYTTTQWSPKNNNYFKYNKKYYIIEPGYYYNIIPDAEFFISNINIVIKVN